MRRVKRNLHWLRIPKTAHKFRKGNSTYSAPSPQVRIDTFNIANNPGLELLKSESADIESGNNQNMHQSITNDVLSKQVYPIVYDENLLDKARSQWQFGDWESLSRMDKSAIEHHPERAKLALLAAAGKLQTNDREKAVVFIQLARQWGISKRLIAQILISGVYNTLGRVALASSNNKQAIAHFEKAVSISLPDADKTVISETRAVQEATKLGLLPQAANLIDKQITSIKQQSSIDSSRIEIVETEIELLHHELSLAQQRKQIFEPQSSISSIGDRINDPDWLAKLEQMSVSQLGQDIWVLSNTNFKRGGFFVEFGATNGILLSNTWLLEKEFGWQGICAEPNPKFFSQLKHNRKCVVSDQYIGRVTGDVIEFILADAYGGSKEFAESDQHKSKRSAYYDAGHVTALTTISLDDFLEQHHAPSDIDYISIDTEGSEYDLLSSFPFEKWNVSLFTIEHNFTEQRERIKSLMNKNGYERIEKEWDDWYINIKSLSNAAI